MKTGTKLALAAGGAAALALWLASRRGHWRGFAGRVVLITGGSRGLGLVLAREFARRGARLSICARDTMELTAARADLERLGAEVLAVPCDVGDRAQAERAVAETVRRFGALDVLVNNAGAIQVGPLDTDTLEDFETAMRVHYWGPLYMALAALPAMRKRREGRIVNIASIGGKVAVPHLLPYCGSKFALVGLSEGLRAELTGTGVAVTTVVPGLMRTGSPANALFKGRHREEHAWFTVSDSIPGLSVSAETAARRIVESCRRGDAELVIGAPAKAAVAAEGLFPGLVARLNGLVARLLPPPGGIGTSALPGYESETPLTRGPLTRLTRRAAARNNEV